METTELPVITPETTTKSSKKKLWIIAFFVIVSVGIIVFLVKLSLSTPSNETAPVATQAYHDKGGYFGIQIPQNWQTSEDMSQGTTGIGTPQEATQDIEEVQMSDGSDTGITIQIYKGQPTCPLDQPLTTTLAGYPASYDATYNTWTIPTTKALITVTTTYPGSNAIRHTLQQNVPTSVPSTVAEQNKNTMMDILKTLKLADLAPVNCK